MRGKFLQQQIQETKLDGSSWKFKIFIEFNSYGTPTTNEQTY